MPTTTLIVGGDSLIGGTLMTELRRAGHQVIGTTRRLEKVGPSFIYLDLSGDLANWECPQAFDVAVLCAGVTKMAECRNNPEGVAQVNVRGMTQIARKLSERRTFLIYLSTNQVFDGTRSHYKAGDPHTPVIEYGRQKSMVEREIAALGGAHAIVRLTKVLDPTNSLLSRWAQGLRKAQPIHPFSDMFMAPVPLSCAVWVLFLLVNSPSEGIIQVSGEKDVSYAEAALLGARVLNVSEDLVRPIQALDSGQFTDYIPRNTTLDTETLRLRFGIEPPAVEWTLTRLFTEPSAIVG